MNLSERLRPPRNEVSTLTFRLWDFTGSALVNLLVFTLLLAYLSPLSYMFITALKTEKQLRITGAPILPAEPVEFDYQGRTYRVYTVPTSEGEQAWALVEPRRLSSRFVDPAHPEKGLITWEGNWRSLQGVFRYRVTFQNFVTLWQSIDYPKFLRNTFGLTLISGLGTLLASIAVAYGFSRFRIPGGKYLFLLLVATIMIPDSITLLPTYFAFVRVLGWNGTWYPLLLPHFFGNAVFIFLLRQNFKSVPREQDEAAMLDGAGPLRILVSVILPQCVPVVATVGLLHFFYMWNELRMASLYLGIAWDLRPVSFAVQSFQDFGFTPEMLQTSALMVMFLPVVVLFLSQRFFMRDMIVTGLEK